ncbi:hypothetical protein PAPYR_6410 [Paratrimastix pyriformis]|uniref:Uncharacterized protein n=1 Tax=Paratrimastix pyriformis TaxID=342808 RepID=A0ABQ8UFI7_9EUKA|nr:hypothetical protein PAPYR_6410 [Paratrimastix pyriformis]
MVVKRARRKTKVVEDDDDVSVSTPSTVDRAAEEMESSGLFALLGDDLICRSIFALLRDADDDTPIRQRVNLASFVTMRCLCRRMRRLAEESWPFFNFAGFDLMKERLFGPHFERQGRNMVELNLSRVRITPALLTAVSRNCIQLRKLNLSQYEDLRDAHICALATGQDSHADEAATMACLPNLEKLDLSVDEAGRLTPLQFFACYPSLSISLALNFISVCSAGLAGPAGQAGVPVALGWLARLGKLRCLSVSGHEELFVCPADQRAAFWAALPALEHVKLFGAAAICTPLPRLRKLTLSLVAHSSENQHYQVGPEVVRQALECLSFCPCLEAFAAGMRLTGGEPYLYEDGPNEGRYQDMLLDPKPLGTLFTHVPASLWDTLTTLHLAEFFVLPIGELLAAPGGGLHGLVRCETWVDASHDGPLVEQWLDQCPDLECVWLKNVQGALLPRLLASMRELAISGIQSPDAAALRFQSPTLERLTVLLGHEMINRLAVAECPVLREARVRAPMRLAELLIDDCPVLDRLTAEGFEGTRLSMLPIADLRLHQLPALRTLHLPRAGFFKWPAEELETYDEVTTITMSIPPMDGAPWLRHFPGLVSLQVWWMSPRVWWWHPGYAGWHPGYGAPGMVVDGTPGMVVDGTPGMVDGTPGMVDGTSGMVVDGTPGMVVDGTPGIPRVTYPWPEPRDLVKHASIHCPKLEQLTFEFPPPVPMTPSTNLLPWLAQGHLPKVVV